MFKELRLHNTQFKNCQNNYSDQVIGNQRMNKQGEEYDQAFGADFRFQLQSRLQKASNFKTSSPKFCTGTAVFCL